MKLSQKSSMAFKLSSCTLGMLFLPTVLAQTISGSVVDQNGNPVANTEVALNHSNIKTTTNPQGQFTIVQVGEGEHELHVAASAYSHVSKHIVVGKDDIKGVVFTLTPTVMENIDVYATPLHSSSIESALPINVLSSDELRLKQASTLGETLKGELGVHSSYFGPVASSPIIRGLDGPRVLITQNGLDVSDASRVGPDHVVSSETSTATQIEVLRGPATLFYGSGAIGGVVNVVDNRIPTNTDTNFDYMLKHNDVSDEDEVSFNFNTGEKEANKSGWAIHLDAFHRDSNDYRIPDDAVIDEEEHDEDESEEEHEEHSGGDLENTAATAYGYTAGVSYLLDNGYIGLSYGRLDREYGIPGHSHDDEEEHEDEEHHDEEEHEEESHDESVYGALKQDRFQLLSDLTWQNGFIRRVKTKVAYTDYTHQEIEDDEVGTTFNNDTLETRFDLYHKPLNDWKGAATLHYKKTDFEAIGEEAFTPPSTTTMLALAWLEEKHFHDVLVQGGIRVENVKIESAESDGITGYDESFSPVSASLGAVWNFSQGYNLGLSFSHSQRAPSAAEILSNGPHIGTGTFELGAQYRLNALTGAIENTSAPVELETSFNTDITFRKFEGNIGFVVSAFYNQVDDYLYQSDTGFTAEIFESEDEHLEHEDDEHAHEDELPVYIYQQADVKLYGIESELIYKVTPEFTATIFGDYIKAKLNDGGYLPRIPPLRIGSELSYTGSSFSASLTAQRYFKQSDVAFDETETDGYTMIDANVNYYVDGVGTDLVVFLKADNILDTDARVHSSFLKDIAPLPARGFSVGIRGSF